MPEIETGTSSSALLNRFRISMFSRWAYKENLKKTQVKHKQCMCIKASFTRTGKKQIRFLHPSDFIQSTGKKIGWIQKNRTDVKNGFVFWLFVWTKLIIGTPQHADINKEKFQCSHSGKSQQYFATESEVLQLGMQFCTQVLNSTPSHTQKTKNETSCLGLGKNFTYATICAYLFFPYVGTPTNFKQCPLVDINRLSKGSCFTRAAGISVILLWLSVSLVTFFMVQSLGISSKWIWIKKRNLQQQFF
jgi:hypothetical protein